MRAFKFWVLAAVLALGGCVTHVPTVASLRHREIQWAPSFAEAQAQAQAQGKPILACLVAGQLNGPC